MARLKLLGNRLVVGPAPMPLASASTGIVQPAKYYDDRKMWSVIQVGPKVQNIVPGDKVLTHGNEEPLFDWPGDNVRVIDASHVLAVWK
jgi:co-chaperonin GroES (HSP10)